MKITCTLSEYTKLARQCGELKARFNCRNCPLNGVAELPEGESCDVERFMQAIKMPESPLAQEIAKRKALEEPTMLNNQYTDGIPDGCVHVTVPRARGEKLETR